MGKYLKQFDTHTQYENYINGSGAILPNVSICTTEGDVHYNPYVEPIETRLVAKFNVTDTTNPTKILHKISGFSAIEIDGVAQQTVVSAYTFSTASEHTVKYTLKDPTTIGENTFASCSGITSIDIPNSVTNIGAGAFVGCSGLTSIDIPDSVTSIGDVALSNCSSLTSITVDTNNSNYSSEDGVLFNKAKTTLIQYPIGNSRTSYTIPSGVTSIGDGAFKYCRRITSIDIPDSATSIGRQTFGYCSGLTSVTIGSGVTSIDNFAFSDCTSLTSIVCNATTAPTISSYTFQYVGTGGTLTVPSGSSGYDAWMGKGLYNWTKVEQ